MYSDTKQIYNGHYIDIRGRFYAGQRYVVGKSRQIVKIPKPQQNLEMYDYALIHKQFVESISIPKLQHIIHPRIYNQNEYIIDVYILEHVLERRFMDVTKESYDIIKSSNHPLFKYYRCKLMVSGPELQKYIYNSKQLNLINNYIVINFIKTLYQI